MNEKPVKRKPGRPKKSSSAKRRKKTKPKKPLGIKTPNKDGFVPVRDPKGRFIGSGNPKGPSINKTPLHKKRVMFQEALEKASDDLGLEKPISIAKELLDILINGKLDDYEKSQVWLKMAEFMFPKLKSMELTSADPDFPAMLVVAQPDKEGKDYLDSIENVTVRQEDVILEIGGNGNGNGTNGQGSNGSAHKESS